MVEKMRVIEMKEFMADLTKYIGKALIRWNKEGWLDKEIFERCGVLQTRLTETKNYAKYGRPITEKYLAAFIGSGIVTVKELIENVPQTPARTLYLNTTGIVFEQKGLPDLIRQCVAEDIDVIQGLTELLNKARNGKKDK